MEEKGISNNKSKYKYGRRRSRSLGGTINTELCNMIDKSLLPAERLKLLVEYSLKNALLISERTLSANVDSDAFASKASECLDRIRNSLEQQDLYTLAVSRPESTSQESLVDYCNEAASKLKEEIQQWDNLKSKEQAARDEIFLKKDPLEITFTGSLDCGKYEKMDYSEILEDISYIDKSHEYGVQRLNSCVEKLKTITITAQELNRYLNKEAEKYFSQMNNSPRTLIKKFHSMK